MKEGVKKVEYAPANNDLSSTSEQQNTGAVKKGDHKA